MRCDGRIIPLLDWDGMELEQTVPPVSVGMFDGNITKLWRQASDGA